jgi:deoxyribonuclease V
MQLNHRHRWDVTPEEAVAIQKALAGQVIYDRPIPLESVRLVAGVDVSVKDNMSQAAVVVLTFPEMEPVETVLAQQPTPFPYVPGLLSYREGPALVEAFELLRQVPDVFIFDGMGRMHPRRMGIAAHMGLWLEKPTIGCGKTHLVGAHDEPAPEKGAAVPVTHRGEQIGVYLRTRVNVKPVYISPGHLIDLESAVRLVLACTSKYRLPDPIRAAHNAAGQFDRS